MKTIKTLFLLSCVTVLFSCAEECKTCAYEVTEYNWNAGMSAEEIAAAEELGMGQAYYEALANAVAVDLGEYCGDELETLEATPATNGAGFNYGVTCVE